MIEVDFLPVGEETNTGDAILCRFLDGTGSYRVVLIDGGFKDTSDEIAHHVRTYYNTRRIDLMVCTHPDDDHINGLPGVFDQLSVTTLLIHRPKNYGHTSDAVKSDKVEQLIATATAHGTDVVTSAFTGQSFFAGAVQVAGPSESYYQELLTDQTGMFAIGAVVKRGLHASAAAITSALRPLTADPGEGDLTDHGGTTPRNNSSIILDIRVDNVRALFTGDAGAPALSRAADALHSSLRDSRPPDFFDIPHHGSRHNLTTDVVNRLLGPIVGATRDRSAFASVGARADDFPRAEVANALTRRGYQVCATRGQKIFWNEGAPSRPGWVPITPLPWVDADN